MYLYWRADLAPIVQGVHGVLTLDALAAQQEKEAQEERRAAEARRRKAAREKELAEEQRKHGCGSHFVFYTYIQ